MGVILRERTLTKGRKSFYLDIHYKGVRSFENLDIRYHPKEANAKRKKILAEKIRNKREMEILEGRFNLSSQLSDYTLFQYYKEIWEDYSGWTYKKYSNAFNYVKQCFKVDRDLRDITKRDCELFLKYMDDKGLSSHSKSTYWGCFRRVLKSAFRSNLIKMDPTHGITIKSPSNVFNKPVLTAEELKHLAKIPCGNDEVKRAFFFSCNTGLGMAEIVKLKFSDIVDGKLIFKRAKNDNDLVIDLSHTALKYLGEGKGYAFKNLPTTANGVNKTLKAWIKKAGIEKRITYYSSRHTFAVLLLEGGANIKVVADLMGHTDVTHTQKYLHYVSKLKKKAVEGLPEY